MTALALLAAALFAWWSLKSALKANPARLARLTKKIGGGAALLGALLLALRGRFDMALLLGGVGAAILGSTGVALPMPLRRLFGQKGRVTRFRSAMIEAELDHDTGRMQGTVLAGTLVGQSLDRLGAAELRELADQCRRSDSEGFQLLEAYLDRRFAGRREHAQGHADTWARSEPEGGAMTEQEAYQVLGLEPGSANDTVRQAHRQLMKKLHPDQGGSTYLASRVNQAKDVLLNRHR